MEFYSPDYKVLIEGTDIKMDGVIISSITLENSVEKADSCNMVIEYDFNMYTSFGKLHENLVIGKELQIDLGYTDDLETLFQGLITGVRIEISDNLEARAIVSGLDKSFKLMKNVNSRSLMKKKYSEIAQTIAGENGLSATVDDTGTVHDYVEQAGISDYQFLCGLAEKSGSEFFVSGSKLYFRKLPDGGSASVTLKLGHNLLSINLETDLAEQIAGVVVTGWDRRKKEMVKGESSPPTLIGSGKSGVAFLSDIQVSSKVVENYHAFIDSADKAKKVADFRMQSTSLKLVRGNATCIGTTELKAGTYVELEGLGSRFDMIYYVRSTTHTIDETGYITVAHLGGNSA
ncbi:MAG: contractile injection system protein, VgrG/Pvc8 family [Syntrophomonadaceae bacterium]|nr:contractile injection system protein, VgrG/Pvc8 family [Syntrophomonadaceae bacterium]